MSDAVTVMVKKTIVTATKRYKYDKEKNWFLLPSL